MLVLSSCCSFLRAYFSRVPLLLASPRARHSPPCLVSFACFFVRRLFVPFSSCFLPFLSISSSFAEFFSFAQLSFIVLFEVSNHCASIFSHRSSPPCSFLPFLVLPFPSFVPSFSPPSLSSVLSSFSKFQTVVHPSSREGGALAQTSSRLAPLVESLQDHSDADLTVRAEWLWMKKGEKRREKKERVYLCLGEGEGGREAGREGRGVGHWLIHLLTCLLSNRSKPTPTVRNKEGRDKRREEKKRKEGQTYICLDEGRERGVTHRSSHLQGSSCWIAERTFGCRPVGKKEGREEERMNEWMLFLNALVSYRLLEQLWREGNGACLFLSASCLLFLLVFHYFLPSLSEQHDDLYQRSCEHNWFVGGAMWS